MEAHMPLAAMLAILMTLNGPQSCGDWTSYIGEDGFTVSEDRGCMTRASEWHQDGTWMEATYTGCLVDFDEPAPDQTARVRLVKIGDGPTMVEFSLFPEDGVLRAHLCEAK
jgi:hypothetical protein